ncbi:ADP-ribose glycohydrolase ARH3 [Balamuthia mandrillaris]
MAEREDTTASSAFSTDKVVGCLLGSMVGDALGAPLQGLSKQQILEKGGGEPVQDLLPGPHALIEYLGDRQGMYTDDTEALLSLAASLVKCGGLSAAHATKSYVKFWGGEPKRGYPPSEESVLVALAFGAPHTTTATRVFPDGSHTVSGAVRIPSIGIAFRYADNQMLWNAVKTALLCSHTHLEGLDAAFVLAKAIALLVQASVKDFDIKEFIEELWNCSKTDTMKILLKFILDEKKYTIKEEQKEDIIGIDIIAFSIQVFYQLWKQPIDCIIFAVNNWNTYSDTIGCIVGTMLGALHGSSWLPEKWLILLENGPTGKDYVISLANNLAKLNLNDIIEI